MSEKKSAEVHALQGTKPRHDLSESGIQGALPRPPKFLSADAKKKFRAMSRQLAQRRAVTEGDADLIAVYVTTDERWQASLVKIRDEGAVCTYERLGADGLAHPVERPNLHLKIAQDCERAKVAILVRLGLTPRDKDHVKPTAPVKPKHAPPSPDSLEGLALECSRLAAAVAAEKKAQAENFQPEPEPDFAELEAAMEKIV